MTRIPRLGNTAAWIAVLGISWACAHRLGEQKVWAADWNARLDAAARWREHPCGDFVFDRWAEEFLADCVARTGARCDRRRAWVMERSNQCDDWQRYLVRNHGKQQRDDSSVEPDMHAR